MGKNSLVLSRGVMGFTYAKINVPKVSQKTLLDLLHKSAKIFAQGGVPAAGPKGMLRKDCGGSTFARIKIFSKIPLASSLLRGAASATKQSYKELFIPHSVTHLPWHRP